MVGISALRIASKLAKFAPSLGLLYKAILPSHFARSATLMGSSLGGLSLGGSLGVNFLVSSTGWFSAIIAGYENDSLGASSRANSEYLVACEYD